MHCGRAARESTDCMDKREHRDLFLEQLIEKGVALPPPHRELLKCHHKNMLKCAIEDRGNVLT
jgi:hypothetical protein